MFSPLKITLLISCLLLIACAPSKQIEERLYIKQLALEEAPYFPRCVATETGTYRQREIDRQMLLPLSDGWAKDTPINDECIVTEP